MELVRRWEKQQPEPPPPVDPVFSGRVLPCYELGMVLVQELFGQMQRLSEDREWEEEDLALIEQGIAQPAEPDSEWTT